MPFCYAPWSNIDINPRGDITPCCKFQVQPYSEKFNIQKNDLGDYVNSKMLNTVKNEFEQGQWPAGCERCRVEEGNSIASKRQLDYQRWKEHYDQYTAEQGFLTATIAFGNTCNLKCLMCSPVCSSLWHQEYIKVYNVDVPPNHFYQTGIIDQLIERMPNIVHCDITGGEPFLSGVKQQKKLLTHWIETGQSKNITLHHITNVTMFPDSEWWELWSHFKNVDLQLSIDGVGARHEYIRFPANWPTVEENVSKYLELWQKPIQLSVSHTASAFNIYYLDEFFDWCEKIGLPTPYTGLTYYPAHMRPSVWPGVAKKTIVDKLHQSRFSDVRVWADMIDNTDDSAQFSLFCKTLTAHEQYRSNSFKQAFPEMAEFLPKNS